MFFEYRSPKQELVKLPCIAFCTKYSVRSGDKHDMKGKYIMEFAGFSYSFFSRQNFETIIEHKKRGILIITFEEFDVGLKIQKIKTGNLE